MHSNVYGECVVTRQIGDSRNALKDHRSVLGLLSRRTGNSDLRQIWHASALGSDEQAYNELWTPACGQVNRSQTY